MGQDKALLEFCGRPMVEIAVEKLRRFCAAVSIAGNRDDLASFAPVVQERRLEAGPAAGIEAGLAACEQPWAMFIPVDVPLVPGELLRLWAERMVAGVSAEEDEGIAGYEYQGSCLEVLGSRQSAFCMLRRGNLQHYTRALDGEQYRLAFIYDELRRLGRDGWPIHDAAAFSPLIQPTAVELEFWFSNVNDRKELEVAELWAKTWRGRAAGAASMSPG
jgi:molybdopterin-guanine dinucleotide biosynthesis protein A